MKELSKNAFKSTVLVAVVALCNMSASAQKKLVITPTTTIATIQDHVIKQQLDSCLQNTPLEKVINGHTFVDLGLPSGTLWATCNVGAETEKNCGDFYAWGETCTKKDYSCKTSKWYGKFHRGKLKATEDVVTIKWGQGTRMPTREDFEELELYCERFLVTYKDSTARGLLIRGRTGKQIFFPVGGHKEDMKVVDKDLWGSYWTSTPSYEHHGNAHTFVFNMDGGCYPSSYDVFERGYLVRPVAD